MKLIRFGELNKEQTGIAIGDKLYSTAAFGEDYNENFFETDGLNRLQKFLNKNKTLAEKPVGRRLGWAVAPPSKIV